MAQIWQASRERNARLGLTGAMVFDGERFCELLEGNADELATVCRDIEFDARHIGMRMLYAALTPGSRRLSDWRSGYCDGADLDIFCGPAALEGEPAVQAFMHLLGRCSLSS
ncbi:BLUF domain-containing protein [Sphaerotilaceae bacterium SBD11-9]